ncbi:MAG: hypothetical protein CO186_00945 [Zetaproteobacteria bacterium CG_4_9_14_3_um_filter_49_83]|nr:MAG: hypothetical protein AUJ56_02280 [Zetaproteobacteria bacterium CG1_02_49_23]PIQ30029.1 MAG: hypothetical protein COW62_13520 [Zetaproteobacteria bacterium CG17_big_fil_post_rev_8_21_14_2_50_50_13]PIV29229.1 MAG: hypothetical protein COS35_13410 [Zetaproteobacteria bacterium CG02_land_8_20_14_3_00_50_9]PIY56023.1 MAG: hypothetical protein COZ00_06755 [Zetaproteobacteria bacterium CG_4_10_14_0_8_um_filter_49_80]PJA36300.1 MAG: hypothetical protein CO186_00945 [Zetaproteobacteria bacterium
MSKLKILSIAMGLCLSVLPQTVLAEDSSPKGVVEAAVTSIVQILEQREDKTRLSEKDREGIRMSVDQRFDYEKMARGSLGSEWNDVSAEQQVDFTTVFRQLLERSYGNKLAGYKGQRIEYDDAEMKKDTRATVLSHVIDSNKSTPVEYRLYQSDSGWKVYDIKIEGVSMVGTFRKDFKSILDKDGFAGLLSQLKEKVEKMRAKDAADDQAENKGELQG